MVEKIDLISGLPETLLHDILSRLPKKDATKTCVLSKKWKEMFYTFPILSICDKDSIKKLSKQIEDEQIKTFIDHGKQGLLRFSDQGLAIKEFRLILTLTWFDHRVMYPDIDQWLKLATECGVQNLKFFLPTLEKGDQHRCYLLHPGAIASRSLDKLVLKGRIKFCKEFLNPSIKFSSLSVLSLSYVLFYNEDAVKNLISCCPLIEDLTLKWCHVCKPHNDKICFMKSLSLQGLENLKGVDIQGVREVEIDVPNIERIYYGAVSHKPCKMNFDSCRNLRDLTIMNTKTDFVISDKWFLNLFANSPLLESLKLEECFMSEKIGISSSQLKSLVLSNCSTMEEIEIDTPNLASFRYYFAGDDLPSIHFRRYSSQLDVNVKLHMIPTCLHQLGKFVKQFRPRKLLTSLSLSMRQEYQNYHYWYPEEEDEEEEEDPFSLPAKVPAPVIEHLFIRSVREIKPDDYLLFVYRLFHCWYPETISLSLNPSHGSKEFIKFLYSMPVEPAKGENSCRDCGYWDKCLVHAMKDECSYCRHKSKCWLHGLKVAKVTRPDKKDVNVVDFAHLKSILGRLSSSENGNISFRLK